MEVLYDGNEIERLCTDERHMMRKRGDIARKLKLRHNALFAATSVGDLLDVDPLGRWHGLSGDLKGLWAGRVSGNWRLLIRPEGANVALKCATVTVIGLDDYH